MFLINCKGLLKGVLDDSPYLTAFATAAVSRGAALNAAPTDFCTWCLRLGSHSAFRRRSPPAEVLVEVAGENRASPSARRGLAFGGVHAGAAGLGGQRMGGSFDRPGVDDCVGVHATDELEAEVFGAQHEGFVVWAGG